MARGIGMDAGAEVFRGVVVREMKGQTHTFYYGPYDKRGTAAGVATQKASQMTRWAGEIKDKYVERTTTVWERV